VLFICHGNICRSPYAAAALRRASTRNGIELIQVDSAGFIGPGRRSPSNAREVARERGIDLDTHVSKVVSPGVVAASDLIVVMDVRQCRAIKQRFEPPQGSVLLLGDLDPEPIQRRTILDPINQSEAFFESVYTRVDRCVAALAEALATDTKAPKDRDA
jgi:protein-tyrosine phosphatase